MTEPPGGRRAAFALGVALLLLAGCGDDASGPPPSPEPLAAPPREDDAKSLLLEGQLLLLAADKDRDPSRVASAVDLLAKAEALEPADPDVIVWRGIGAVMQGEEADARAAVARLRTKTPFGAREPRLHYLNALVIMRFGGKPDEALRELRQAKKLGGRGFLGGSSTELMDRALYKALVAVAEDLTRNRQADAAVQALREAARIARSWPVEGVTARRHLATVYQRAMRFLEAEEEWRSLVVQYPTVADFRMGLAGTHAVQHEHEEAAKEYTEVLRLVEDGKVPPNEVRDLLEARMRRANSLRHLGRLEEAQAEIERYVKEFPENGIGHYWLGILWFDGLDKPVESVAHLERARALLPFCDQPLVALEKVYQAIGDAAKAAAVHAEIEAGKQTRLKALETVLKENPNKNVCD